jgi:hypothetical protein
MARYSTLMNRSFELDELGADERAFLAEVLEHYRTEPDWSDFSTFWVNRGHTTVWADRDRKEVVKSPAWRICQDLETRLGTRQGKVAFPT